MQCDRCGMDGGVNFLGARGYECDRCVKGLEGRIIARQLDLELEVEAVR